jgi:WD40 repeat protein
MRLTLFWLLSCTAAVAVAADPPDYNTQIAPFFKTYCTGCHNADDQEGKLVLERYPALLAGGQHGAVVVPGKSGESRLIQVLTGKAKPVMPPEDEDKPSADQIALLAAWIDAGARGPQGAEPDPTILAVPKIVPTRPAVDPLTAISVSPKGDLLALAGYGEVELRRRADRTLLHTLAGHRGRVTFVSFSSDGSRLLAAAGEPGLFGEVRMWNVADGSLLRTFTGHRDSLYSAVLSPDGSLLATCSYDQTIRLWDVASGNELRTLAGHNDAVYDIAFRPDGRVLASASGDRTIKLWDVASGARLDTLSQSLKELYTVAFRPDGKQVAAGGVDGRIRVWNVSEHAKENTNPLALNRAAHEGPVSRLVYSPDGALLVSASEDRTIRLWDAASLEPRGKLEVQSDWPAALACAPDGLSLLVGRLDGTLSEYPLGSRVGAGPLARRLPLLAEVVSYGAQPPIDQLAKTPEVEPNDEPGCAGLLPVPGVATGSIAPAQGKAIDADLFRFDAKVGERWIIETAAARSGSKLDSRIEVLHADARPVERLLLRAVRDSELEFRSEDSTDRGLRLANFEELELDSLVYLEGEVIRHYRQRRGPDDDAQFYPDGGPRVTFFDTSPRAHALGAKCYFVEPYPVEAELPYNGLPVFSVEYENDDDGERKLGADSRLSFTAPADGPYLVRVTDVRGFGGEGYSYQLIVRRPEPSFNVTVADRDLTVPAGSGKRINIAVDRIDGFWGEVRVDFSGLPPGFFVTTPLVVQAGHRDAHGVLFAHPAAVQPTEEHWAASKIMATATVAGREVTKEAGNLGKLQLGPKPKILVRLATPEQPARQPSTGESGSLDFPHPAELTLAPGGTITCQLSAERNGFTGIINFEADNLPHGVIVDNIGLNGIQLLEGQTERTLYLSAEGWLPDEDRMFQLYAKEDGVQASLPLLLHVRKNAAIAGGSR